MNFRTLKDLKRDIEEVEKQGIDLSKVEILLSDDDEMNGVHYAYFKGDFLSGLEYNYYGDQLRGDYEKHKWFVIS